MYFSYIKKLYLNTLQIFQVFCFNLIFKIYIKFFTAVFYKYQSVEFKYYLQDKKNTLLVIVNHLCIVQATYNVSNGFCSSLQFFILV